MSVSRVVTFLTPVFVALSAWLCNLAAQYMPGHPHLDSTQLTALMVAGAGAALAIAAHWLSGLQKHEARVAEQVNAVTLAQLAPPAKAPVRKPAVKD